MMAASQIGKLSCRVNLREGDIFIALRVHIDSSGKVKDKFMTIAAFAGTDELWETFETEWRNILQGHTPKAEYVHMKEVNLLDGGFSWKLGWTTHKAFSLVGKCLVYMSHLDKERFRMFYCTIDLEAWRKLGDEGYDLQEPIEMCNEFCVFGIQYWYTQKYPHPEETINLATDSAHYFFDRGEAFKQPFEDRWNAEKEKFENHVDEVYSPWLLIDQVSSVEMKKVPGIQAADILAWSVNREKFAGDNFPGKAYLHIMRQVIPCGSMFWDEEKMRKNFGMVAKP